jgi:hypothetical protein
VAFGAYGRTGEEAGAGRPKPVSRNPVVRFACMKRIYFEIDNPAFLAWLKTRPRGSYTVLIGSETPDNALDAVFAKVATDGADLAAWLAEKLHRGELKIKVHTKAKLPQGIVLE